MLSFVSSEAVGWTVGAGGTRTGGEICTGGGVEGTAVGAASDVLDIFFVLGIFEEGCDLFVGEAGEGEGAREGEETDGARLAGRGRIGVILLTKLFY